jgi:hypothetical protein
MTKRRWHETMIIGASGKFLGQCCSREHAGWLGLVRGQGPEVGALGRGQRWAHWAGARGGRIGQGPEVGALGRGQPSPYYVRLSTKLAGCTNYASTSVIVTSYVAAGLPPVAALMIWLCRSSIVSENESKWTGIAALLSGSTKLMVVPVEEV